jgi:hypothetical protein
MQADNEKRQLEGFACPRVHRVKERERERGGLLGGVYGFFGPILGTVVPKAGGPQKGDWISPPTTCYRESKFSWMSCP